MKSKTETYCEKIQKTSSKELLSQLGLLKSIDDLAKFLSEKKNILTFYLSRNIPDGKKYKEFTIPKKSGGVRQITAPKFGLKRILKKLNWVFQNIYYENSKPSAHGFIHHRSIVTNAQNHLNKNYVLNIDLKDFFPSIHFGRIKGLLCSKPFNLNEGIAQIISNLCCINECLPQGAPTSPILSNMVCFKLDGELQKLALANKCKYTRYADDITFSTTKSVFPEQIGKLFNNNSIQNSSLANTQEGDEISQYKQPVENSINLNQDFVNIIENAGFKINNNKVRIQSKEFKQEVTGIKVNTKLNVERSYIRFIKVLLHCWENEGLERAQSKFNSKMQASKENSKKGYRNLVRVIRGRIEFVGQVRGKEDEIYKKLKDRFDTLIGKKKKSSDTFESMLSKIKVEIITIIEDKENLLINKLKLYEKLKEKIDFLEKYLDEYIGNNNISIENISRDSKFLNDYILIVEEKLETGNVVNQNKNPQNFTNIQDELTKPLEYFNELKIEFQKKSLKIDQEIKKLQEAIHFGLEPEKFEYINSSFYNLRNELQDDNLLMKKARREKSFTKFCGYVWKQLESSCRFIYDNKKDKKDKNLSNYLKEQFDKGFIENNLLQFSVESWFNELVEGGFIENRNNFAVVHNINNKEKNGFLYFNDYVKNCRHQAFHGDYRTNKQRLEAKNKKELQDYENKGNDSEKILYKQKTLDLRLKFFEEENYSQIEEKMYLFLSIIFKNIT